jgi:hypothetical protein
MRRETTERFETARDMSRALRECVRHLTTFELEQRTGRFIHNVLGERLRTRERAIHAAFEHFSASSSLACSDTLPLDETGPPPGSDTLGSQPERDPGPVAGGPHPRALTLGRRSVPLTLIALSCATLVALWLRPEADVPSVARPGSASPGPRHGPE